MFINVYIHYILYTINNTYIYVRVSYCSGIAMFCLITY